MQISIHIIKFSGLKTSFCTILAEILGMAGEDRRHSIVLTTNPFIEVTDTTLSLNSTQPMTVERTPSPTDELLSWRNSSKIKHKTTSEIQYAETEVEELLSMLRETESLEEQGDILQYLVSCFIFNL